MTSFLVGNLSCDLWDLHHFALMGFHRNAKKQGVGEVNLTYPLFSKLGCKVVPIKRTVLNKSHFELLRITKMDIEHRKQKIESYGRAHLDLETALEQFPREMWQFRPAEDQWTIHEIMIHITDSEVNSYVRARRLIAEPGGAVLGYDEGGWAKRLGYHQQSVKDALELFRVLRQATYHLIKDQPADVWKNTVQHTEDGTITMDTWLDTYERHIPEHIQQMQLVYQAWKK